MDFDICVIGCGARGKKHAEWWRGRKDAQVLSVFDPDASRREELADALGARAFDDAIAAMEVDGVNVVSICSPVSFHREHTCAAAERGRHVLVEKSLALNIADGERMIHAAREHDVKLAVHLQHRLSHPTHRLKTLIDDGAFGDPLMARYDNIAGIRPKRAMHRRSMNNGPVLDMTAHWIDLMRHFTGGEAHRVIARGHIFGADKPGLDEIDRDDLAIDSAEMLVEFDGGHLLSMRVAWGLPDGFGMQGGEWLVGPGGHAQLVSKELHLRTASDHEVVQPDAATGVCLNNLAEALHGRGSIAATGEDGLEALRVSLAALESIDTGEPVEVSSIR